MCYGFIIACTITSSAAYADEHALSPIDQLESSIDDLFGSSSITAELFIPSDMILSETYHGVFIRSDNYDSGQIISLATDSDIARLPDSVFIPAGKNHALFPISLHGTGEVNIVARSGDTFWKSESKIHDNTNSDYRIFLALPEKTDSTSEILVALYIVDDFFNPVSFNADKTVSIVTTNMDAPESVTVRAGKSHTFFPVDIRGDSSITAYSEYAVSDTAYVSYDRQQHTVHLGFAPQVMAPHSFGYAFAWITDENDNLVRPPLPIPSQIHVSENNVLSVDGEFTTSDTMHLLDGFHHQKIYSHHAGNSTVTINVPGYGAASQDLSVRELPREFDSKITEIEFNRPNHVESYIFPPVTDHESFLIVSMFHDTDISDIEVLKAADDEEEKVAAIADDIDEADDVLHERNEEVTLDILKDIGISDTTIENSELDIINKVAPDLLDSRDIVAVLNNGTHVTLSYVPDDDESDDEETAESASLDADLYPVFGVDYASFAITSQNLNHDKIVEFEHDGIPSQSMIVPLDGKVTGTHTVSVSSANIPVSEAMLQIKEHEKYELSITSLPYLGGDDYYPLLALSVVDSAGVTVSPHHEFGDLTVKLLSDDIEFRSDTVRLSEVVTFVEGKSQVRHPGVTAITQTKDIVSVHKSSYKNQLEVDIQAPSSVHSAEQFPAYAYLLGIDGRPVSVINDHLQSDCIGTAGGSLFSCDTSSQFTIFENSIGFAAKAVDVFENEFDINDIRVDFGRNENLYVQSEHLIDVSSANDVDYDVISDIPYTITENGILLSPKSPGTYDILVQFTRPGFDIHSESRSYTVSNEVLVDILTVDQNGSPIKSAASISSTDGEDTSFDTPQTAIPVRRGAVHLEFPQDITIGTVGYSFESLTHDGVTYEHNILDISLFEPAQFVATYQNVIRVNVVGGTGSGLYSQGETFSLEAPSRDVVGFLIRDSFHHWSYLPAGYDIYSEKIDIAADQSFDTSVIYRPDYSGMIAVAIAISLAMFALLKRDRIIGIARTYTKR